MRPVSIVIARAVNLSSCIWRRTSMRSLVYPVTKAQPASLPPIRLEAGRGHSANRVTLEACDFDARLLGGLFHLLPERERRSLREYAIRFRFGTAEA